MKLKLVLLCTVALSANLPSQAQILKKIKDKVNKTINNATGSESSATEEESSTSASQSTESEKESKNESNSKVKWCDTVSVKGVGADGVEYTKAYSGTGRVNIIYQESSLGLQNDGDGYRIILSERVNNKTQFSVVENGKVVSTGPQVDTRYISNNSFNGTVSREDKGQGKPSKYIVGDTLKQDIPKSDAKNMTITKVEDDQFEMAMAMARETDDYKNMSEEEKKEFEKTAREGMAKHNAMAGTTVAIPAQQGGSMAVVTGYNLIVKGKNYGKFQMPPVVEVSQDETKVFAVGLDDKGSPVLIADGKKTMLDKSKYMGSGGYILRSPDQKKFVYIEQKKMSDEEIDAISTAAASGKVTKLSYNVLRSDGSSLSVTDHSSTGKFILTNSGAVVHINEKTGQVFADNKAIGKFAMQGRDWLDSDAILIGNDLNQVAYYNGDDGSLNYLDGSVRKLGITFPKVITRNGKSYLSWFRQCGNDIYIAKFAY